jgi:hypothetical protein
MTPKKMLEIAANADAKPVMTTGTTLQELWRILKFPQPPISSLDSYQVSILPFLNQELDSRLIREELLRRPVQL